MDFKIQILIFLISTIISSPPPTPVPPYKVSIEEPKLKEANPKLWIHPGKFFARFAETKEDAIKLCKLSREIQMNYLQLIDSWKAFYNDYELDLYEKD